MNTKNHYYATIGERTEYVNIFDLPYGDFNIETPLVINSDVVLADKQRSTDLSNVIVIGDFDFSKQGTWFVLPKRIEGRLVCQSLKPMRDPNNPKQKINFFDDFFIFPDGITEIDCTHTIKNFDYFIGRLPSTVKTITVADSMLTALSSDPEKIESANKLLQYYPDLVVVSSKKKIVLSEELARIANQTSVEQEQNITEEIVEAKTKNEEQPRSISQEYITKNDIVLIFKDEEYIKSFDLTTEEIERIVRKLMGNYNKIMLRNQSGVDVSCILFDDFVSLYDDFVYVITEAKAEAERQAQGKTQETKQTKPVPQKTKTVPESSSVPRPITIKKYIPKQMLTDIEKTCGGIDAKIMSVLETISSVNTDINETKSGAPVQIITGKGKNRTRISCGYLQKEPGNCIVQSVDTTKSNDRKRIVWTYLPKERVLVCVKVYEEHFCNTKQNKNSLQYKQTVKYAAKSMDNDGRKITPQMIIDEGYFDVEDLLTEYKEKTQKQKAEEKEPEQQIDEPTPVVVPQPEQTETPMQTQVIEQPVLSEQPSTEITTKPKRQRVHIKKKTAEPVNYTPRIERVGYTLVPEETINHDEKTEDIEISPADIVPAKTKETILPPVQPVVESTCAEIEGTKETKEEKTDTPLSSGTPQHTEQTVEPNIVKEKIIRRKSTPKNMVDVFAIQAELESFMKLIDKAIKSGYKAAAKEADATKQLEIHQTIGELLIQKQKLQSALPEFSKTSELLNDIIQKTNSR